MTKPEHPEEQFRAYCHREIQEPLRLAAIYSKSTVADILLEAFVLWAAANEHLAIRALAYALEAKTEAAARPLRL